MGSWHPYHVHSWFYVVQGGAYGRLQGGGRGRPRTSHGGYAGYGLDGGYFFCSVSVSYAVIVTRS